MKKDIHPSNYREVAFKDMSNEEVFITRSTVNTKETIEIDGTISIPATIARLLSRTCLTRRFSSLAALLTPRRPSKSTVRPILW